MVDHEKNQRPKEEYLIIEKPQGGLPNSFFEGLRRFQYGETAEESDQGFEQMRQAAKKIPIEELLRIKKDIEESKLGNSRSIINTEFSWLYRPNQPLEILERIATSPESSALQMIGVGVESPGYANTDALAHIHNHPSGLVIPTNADIDYFLRSIQRNQDLRYELIASTSEEVVSGFYVMEYTGDRESLSKKLTQLDECFQGHAKKRKKEMEDFPDRFSHIGVGDSIFTQEEYAKISLELMELAGVKHYAVAMPNYKFQDWQFIKE